MVALSRCILILPGKGVPESRELEYQGPFCDNDDDFHLIEVSWAMKNTARKYQ